MKAFFDLRPVILLLLVASAVPMIALARHPATDQLLKYLEQEGQSDYSQAREVVERLVTEGAELGETNSWGATPVVVATETYAVLFSKNASPAILQSLLAALDFLYERSPNISSPDYRGITPLHYLVRFGSSSGTPALDTYLSRNPDLGAGGSILAALLLGRSDETLFSRMLSVGPSRGLPLLQLDREGATTLMALASRNSPFSDGKLPIEKLLSQFSVPEIKTHLEAQNAFGETVLSRAALLGNRLVVQYLLSLTPVSSLNTETWEGNTPLMLADLSGNKDVVAMLEARGATRRSPKDNWACNSSNDKVVSVESLRDLIRSCNVRRMEDLLDLLPRRLRSRVIVSYRGHGLQTASVEFPRIFMFEPDGSFVATFNGHPSQAKFLDLEMIQYRKGAKKFELFNLNFARDRGVRTGAPRWSRSNPKECIGCHGQDPRPFWDTWSLWAASRGGEMTQTKPFFPYEQQAVDRFEQLRRDPSTRYSRVFPDATTYIETEYGINTAVIGSMNYQFNYLTKMLVGEKVARQVRSKASLYPYRYAMLAALSCRDSVEGYIPEQRRQRFRLSLADLVAHTKQNNKEEFRKRLDFHAAAFPGYPQEGVGRYTRLSLDLESGRNFDPERIGAMRYIVENVAGPNSMNDWFRVFGDGKKTYYSEDLLTSWEAAFWRQFLDPVSDQPIYEIYARNHKRAYRGEPVLSWLYWEKSTELATLCPLLKEKSLSALKIKPSR